VGNVDDVTVANYVEQEAQRDEEAKTSYSWTDTAWLQYVKVKGRTQRPAKGPSVINNETNKRELPTAAASINVRRRSENEVFFLLV
jgi:hypothetical protein